MWPGVEPERGVYNETYLNIMKGIVENCQKESHLFHCVAWNLRYFEYASRWIIRTILWRRHSNVGW